MNAERYLIVNADDFGQSAGFNRGVIEAHERGIVTSASLMVRWPDAREAARYARQSSLSVGLHVDLGEWAHRNGSWEPVYEVVDTADPAAVEREVQDQLEAFRALLGRDPTHVDSHQHVHRSEPAATVLTALAETLGVPLRDRSSRVTYDGRFYGQTGKGEPHHEAITVGALVGVLASLPPGWTELGCHPGRAASFPTVYLGERTVELDTLCAPEVSDAVDRHRLQLRSFHDVPAARGRIPASPQPKRPWT